jgi:hypothetical protein
MTSISTDLESEFVAALKFSERSSEIPESADAYGWLVGSWEIDILYYRTDVRDRNLKGEVHFGWVLEGRAVQDVWIMPQRSARHSPPESGYDMYGTTIRVWDASLQAWRVTWINPVSGQVDRLVGRWEGKDIVQIGTHADGSPIRWIFSEITPNSFRWIGEVLSPDGKTWKLEGEFCARRIR